MGTTADSATTVPGPVRRRTPLRGFGEIAFEVVTADGRARCGCALLADTPARHQRGLMEQRDLGGYDGMLFVFPTDTTTRFYMKNTPLPLTIAWFEADGDFVSAADMDPCLTTDDCPRYAAARPYRFALEVVRGGLARLAVGPGTRLVPGRSPCPE